jgi:uncharacterized OB-fold protein
MPDPAPSPAAVFADHCARGELAYQVAPDGSAVFPPRLAQPGTGAPLRWSVSAGRGVVHAATVVRRRGEPPAGVVLVDLDEGFRMMSRVDELRPEDVRIGLRVELRFDGDVPVFVPAKAPA